MKRLVLLLALAGCSASSEAPTASPMDASADAPGEASNGPNEATVAKCLSCHYDKQLSWSRISSHSLLLDCNSCHDTGSSFPHPDHPKTLGCTACHSEPSHPKGAACATCHDPHGTPNASLVRGIVPLPGGGTAQVRYAKSEGASADGLVRAGVLGQVAGTGLCEVCHTATAHYDALGKAAPHAGAWCAQCHSHQDGFSPADAGAPADSAPDAGDDGAIPGEAGVD